MQKYFKGRDNVYFCDSKCPSGFVLQSASACNKELILQDVSLKSKGLFSLLHCNKNISFLFLNTGWDVVYFTICLDGFGK